MFGPDLTGGLHCSRRRQDWRQRFTEEGRARSKRRGVAYPPFGFRPRDAQTDGHQIGKGLGAELLGGGLGGQPGEDAVRLRRELPGQDLQFAEHGEEFAVSQCVERGRGEFVVRGPQCCDRFAHCIQIHASNTSSNH